MGSPAAVRNAPLLEMEAPALPGTSWRWKGGLFKSAVFFFFVRQNPWKGKVKPSGRGWAFTERLYENKPYLHLSHGPEPERANLGERCEGGGSRLTQRGNNQNHIWGYRACNKSFIAELPTVCHLNWSHLINYQQFHISIIYTRSLYVCVHIWLCYSYLELETTLFCFLFCKILFWKFVRSNSCEARNLVKYGPHKQGCRTRRTHINPKSFT